MADIATRQNATHEKDLAGEAPRVAGRDAAADTRAPVSLNDITQAAWQSLAIRAIEPNAYYLPGFSRSTDMGALAAFSPVVEANSEPALWGLMPVLSAWSAYKLPLPALVGDDPYHALGTVLLDREHADEAATQLMQHARIAGAHALILRNTTIDGPSTKTFARALDRQRLKPHILNSYERAVLQPTPDADALLRDALGGKKFKELRRQRHRLDEQGEVIFTIASTPLDIDAALDVFLTLEASGWKGRRGTALRQNNADHDFIRHATRTMASRDECEIVTLHSGATPIASAIVFRHLDRAFYFKLGVDERFAKFSPGVLLTMELTKHLCADDQIALADSTSAPGNAMIDRIWRGRQRVGDVLIPLYRRDPLIAAMRVMLRLRIIMREPARRVVNNVRKWREASFQR